MAVIYLSSVDGNDSDSGLTWALAKATLVAAMAAAGNGGTVYVDSAHSESGPGTKQPDGGTAAAPINVICVVRGADVTPPTQITTGAIVATTTGGITFGNFGCRATFVGIEFRIGTASSSTVNICFSPGTNIQACVTLINCKLTIASTGASSRITSNSSGSESGVAVVFINTTVKFANTGQKITLRVGSFVWRNTLSLIDTSGSLPTSLLSATTGTPGSNITFQGVDFSGLGANAIVDLAATPSSNYLFENCRLGSSLVTGTIPSLSGARATFINCDSADTNYRYAKYVYQGSVTHEATIVRSGGASDGTTAISRKMVSLSPTFYTPLESDWVTFWNESTGSPITVSAAVLTDGVTLTDAEAWIEVEYLGTSGYPLSVFASDCAADILATPANQPTDTASVWTTTGLSSPVKQTLSKQVTPAKKGLCRARVCLAKASTTMYFDPKLDLGF